VRRENDLWSKLLTEFNSSAQSLVDRGTVPLQLGPLKEVVDAAARSTAQLAVIAADAAVQLETRRKGTINQLQGHLNKTSFETHPQRDKAEELQRDLKEQPALPANPSRVDFQDIYDLVGSAESFIDGLESARRTILDKIELLKHRFDHLNALNAESYRPAMATRLNAMRMGINRALASDQLDPLTEQLLQMEDLIDALERDVTKLIAAETEQAAAKVDAAIKVSSNTKFIGRAQGILVQLEERGHFETPSYYIRQRLKRTVDEVMPAGREAKKNL
jgi:hypothetical protein